MNDTAMNAKEWRVWEKVKREPGVCAAEAHFFETMFKKAGGRTHTEEELQTMVIAFATLHRESWKTCRYARCKRAGLCTPPDRAASDPKISDEHRKEMAWRHLPPCLIEPGWMDIKDEVFAAMEAFQQDLRMLGFSSNS